MDDFKTAGRVLLQPTTVKDAREYKITVCSAADENDGHLPYGSTIASVAVTAYDMDGSDVTSDLINGTPSLSDFVVTVLFDWPTTNGAGRYKISIDVTLTGSGSVLPLDFDRIVAKDN